MNDPTDPVESVDILSQLAQPETRRNPYPFLHWLREHDPVHRTRAGFYLLSRHADVQWVLENTGSVFRGPDRERHPEALRHRSRMLFLNSIAMKDPPEHTRLRALLNRGLTPHHVWGLRERIAQISDRLLDAITEPLRDGETVDLHSSVSIPLTTGVFVELIGVPVADSAWLASLVADIYPAAMPLPQDGVVSYDEMLAKADECTAELESYFLELFAQRRRAPGEDLISALVAKRDDDLDQLGDDELISMLWILWVAGVETSAGGVDQCLRAMLIHPDQHGWLHGDLGQVTAFAGEALRCYGSSLFAGISRVATRDVEFDGGTIPAGSDVRPSLAAANRDPAVFPNPDRFDPSRDLDAALSFGHGMRSCPATSLSLAELTVSLPRIHARFPSLVSAGEPSWHERVATRLLRRLPAALDTRPNA